MVLDSYVVGMAHSLRVNIKGLYDIQRNVREKNVSEFRIREIIRSLLMSLYDSQ
ncbi:MAG: hypothetical protein ACI92E_001495 [Oceanicoccus sp.]